MAPSIPASPSSGLPPTVLSTPWHSVRVLRLRARIWWTKESHEECRGFLAKGLVMEVSYILEVTVQLVALTVEKRRWSSSIFPCHPRLLCIVYPPGKAAPSPTLPMHNVSGTFDLCEPEQAVGR